MMKRNKKIFIITPIAIIIIIGILCWKGFTTIDRDVCEEKYEKIREIIESMNSCTTDNNCEVVPYGSTQCRYPLAISKKAKNSLKLKELKIIHSLCLNIHVDLEDAGVDVKCLIAVLPPANVKCIGGKCVLTY